MVALILALELFAAGDVPHGRALYRLHCMACHDAALRGAPSLRDPALIGSRTDAQLAQMFLKGAAGHPAPGTALSQLDADDLVAFLRAGVPSITDVFPDAAAYTAKSYTLEGPALTRAESLAGDDLKPAEKQLTVFSVYSGERPATGPRLVPDDPVQLDELSPRTKRGYVVFGQLGGAPLAMALAPDSSVARIWSPAAELQRVAPAVVGKGGREPGRRKPFVSKAAPQAAQTLTRLYARALEAAAIAAREEAERHRFDAPEGRKASP